MMATPARSEVMLSGLAEVTARSGEFAARLNSCSRGDNPYNSARVRLFADAQLDSSIAFVSEILLDVGAPIRLNGAYVALRPWNAPFEAQVGKVPFIIGLYPQRCYGEQNPLIGAPLLYHHHSILRRAGPPPATVTGLLALRDSIGGLQSISPATPALQGVPAVDESWWDSAIQVRGEHGRVQYAAGVSVGTTSVPRDLDTNSGKQVMARVVYRPVPALAVGGSFARGPYLDRSALSGGDLESYNQDLIGGDAEFTIGHVESRAEVMHVAWDLPTQGAPRVSTTGGYVEGRVMLGAGIYVAARAGGMLFDRVTSASGESRRWDVNVGRIESGLGYFFGANTLIKATYQLTTGERGSRLEGWRGVYGFQLVARL
jgi:hypothetical protein